MTSPLIEISRITKTLESCSPNLMPFHISYSGPAPISTYFLVKPSSRAPGVPEDNGPDTTHQTVAAEGSSLTADGDTDTVMESSTQEEGSQDTLVAQSGSMSALSEAETIVEEKGPERILERVKVATARFVAAFRGRPVHGLQVDLPQGYRGLVLSQEGDLKTETEGEQRSKAKGKAKTMTKPKSKTGRRTTRSGSHVPEMIDVDVEEEAVANSEESNDDGHELGAVVKTLKPTGTFSSFVIWRPDLPVDEGADEYLRALTEWTALAAEIHRVDDES